MGLQTVGYNWATLTFTITSFFFSSSMNFSTSINSHTHHHSQGIEELHNPKTLLVSQHSHAVPTPSTAWQLLSVLNDYSVVFSRISYVVYMYGISSAQFSHSVVSNFATPRTAARLPCPSPTATACSNPWPSNQWCHPTVSSSVVPFPSCLQSFPAAGSFPLS